MRTSQASRFARWAALAALAVAAIAAGVYVRRVWQAQRARRNAPAVVPSSVQQSSAEFAFSKVENERTLFTVRASRATQFKDQRKNLLEDVWITIYGRDGNRNDNIHTGQCNYDPSSGRMGCEGDVQLDLQSAGEVREKDAAHAIHVATRNITFDRSTGIASTNQPVTFRFLYGEGHSLGASYSARDATMALQRNVELTLHPAASQLASSASASSNASKRAQSAGPIVLSSGSLIYHSGNHRLEFSGPVHVKQGNGEMFAGAMTLELDQDLRARRALAKGEPKLIWTEQRNQSTIQASQFAAFFHPQGWAEQLLAEDHVRASRTTPVGKDQVTAQRLEVQMSPGRNQPRQATAQGQVAIRSVAAGVAQNLETDALRLFFVPDSAGGPTRIDHAETLAPARLERKAAESSILHAQRLSAIFNHQNRLHQLLGKNGVEISRQVGAVAAQTSSSREFVVDYAGRADWTQLEQSGSVRIRQGDRSATAEHAQFIRSAETIQLTGSATATDSQSRTTAQAISFRQPASEVRAEGGVSTTYFAAQHNTATGTAEPADITAEHMQANSATGQAVYSGHARWWQGSAVIQADTISLFRDEQRLEAQGGVHGAFPQAPQGGTSPTQTPAGSRARSATEGTNSSKGSNPAKGPAKPVLWRFRAAALTYSAGDRRAHLSGGVNAESGQERIDADQMDLFVSNEGTGPAELSRASATGRVTVRQGGRWATAERADYSAPEGKFVLSGGKPALYDSSGNIATGRQLTFFLASDKILIDSGEGSRTLTKHRVEK